MAREEFDESLYRRPEKKDAEGGEEDKTRDAPAADGAGAPDGAEDKDAGGEEKEAGGDTRSAWDDDEDGGEQPVSRRKFMPDDDEPPEDEKPEGGAKDEKDGKDGKTPRKGAKKSSGDVRKGRRRITSGGSDSRS